MHFRDGTIRDAAQLAHVFFTAVRCGDSPYTEAQRAAWLPAKPTTENFVQRLSGQFVAVAEFRRTPVGFMTLRSDGYIDLAFIVPQARGQGAFRHMFEIVEKQVYSEGASRLWTHASLTAEPAFQAMGFSVIQREAVDCAGQKLRRALMEKKLT